MVDIRGVEYRADRTVILNGVNARLERGAFNVILGPNGAGKSTLLKIATGLLRPTAGDVRYGDQLLTTIAPHTLARFRAVLSQRVDLAFPLTVHDVVLMGRYPHYGRVPSSVDRGIVDRSVDLVGLSAKREQSYPTLSSGEQQKAQLARVLAQIWNYDDPSEHKYLFLDEPTTSLDIHYQIQILDLARDLLRYNCTVIAILHDLNVASEYAGHFIVLDRGSVACEADRAEDLSAELIERVFAIRTYRVPDATTGRFVWRFRL